MNDQQQQRPRPVVNLSRLADEIEHHEEARVTGTPARNLPRTIEHQEERRGTSLQAIALAITLLTWKDAEKMGSAIQMKMKDGGQLTAAIQAWAEEWEKFE